MNNQMIIAPCGMNCSLCIAYQRKKKNCSGCTGPDENKPRHCISCSIKNCEYLHDCKSGFCFTCAIFPCKRLKQLDTSYRTKYGMSMIQNLCAIDSLGLEKHIEMEKEKWACKKCGLLICAHRETCQFCGAVNKFFPSDKI